MPPVKGLPTAGTPNRLHSPPVKPTLQIGNTAEVTITVTEDMCPAFDGVVVHHVYSTWSMAHHMEIAARKVLAPHLDVDEEGIGAHLKIDHLAPAPVGHAVRICAEAVELDDRRLVCDVTAWDGTRLLGQGQQIQRVLPKTLLAKLIERSNKATDQ